MRNTSLISVWLTGLALSVSSLSAIADEGYDNKPNDINIELFAPAKGDSVGIGGKGWFVDIAVQYEGDLDTTGFTDFQITGPGPHNDVAPFPGTFSPGADERLPGVIVLLSTTTIGGGSCQNLANLFNLTGVTNLTEDDTEIWDTWIVGAPLFGVGTQSKVYIAVADDINNDGVYNDAPDIVPDSNNDGKCNSSDLNAYGIASNIAKSRFYINN